MKRFLGILALAIAGLVAAHAADWLNTGGDASHSGWQKRERYFKLNNVGGLKLLWSRQLDNRSRGPNSLAGPVMMGPIITHRGIKELIFLTGASDSVFAVDADLGRVFWKRQIESGSPLVDAPPPCGLGLTSAPAIEPDLKPPPPIEDDDYRTTIRPIYVLASDGRLHKMSPATGLDMGSPWAFLKPGANASRLTFQSNIVTAMTTGGCAGIPDGEWSIHLPDAAVSHAAAPPSIPTSWEDDAHIRWSYEVTSTGINAFRNNHEAVWSAGGMVLPKQPVVTQGILFVLSAGNAATQATLHAFDAKSGNALYSSGEIITSFVQSSGLAVANGHVTFATNDNTLYCFGFPLEIF